MVQRIYVEKKPALRQEAAGLLSELRTVLGIQTLREVRDSLTSGRTPPPNASS